MSKIPNGHEIISLFESMYPKHLAMEGDKIGLQIGALNKPVRHVLIALDVTEEVVDEAIQLGANVIIAHHPLIFNPLKAIHTDKAYGKIIEKCIKNDIAIYAAHTNVDVAKGGVNDLLAEALGLQNTEVLAPTYAEEMKKVVVFVPVTHAEEVRNALGDAGAGHIGNYSHCTFSSEGTGTFVPQEGTNPYIGETGQLERVEEVRIETIIPASLQRKVIKAMVTAHPYEEVAYDVYPLDNKGETLGLGKIGYLQEEMTLGQFAEHVKQSLDVKGARVVGKLDDKVRKVAVLGGDILLSREVVLPPVEDVVEVDLQLSVGKSILGEFLSHLVTVDDDGHRLKLVALQRLAVGAKDSTEQHDELALVKIALEPEVTKLRKIGRAHV